MKLVESILGILFPPFCEICGIKLSCKERYICRSCLKKIVINTPPFCRRCSRHISRPSLVSGAGPRLEQDRGRGNQLCQECLNTNSRLEQVWSWGIYGDILKKFVYLFKYKKRGHLLNVLKNYLYEFFEQNRITENIDIIIPVPLHPLKLKQRTFNQSEIIAWLIAKKYKKDVLNLLVKRRFTTAQNQLNKIERRKNIKDSFESRNIVFSGKNILIVDDIFTTGTTMNECARVLLKGGAGKVYGFTLARGL